MEVTMTTVSEQTMNNAWSGLPAGNDGFRPCVSSWRTQKTCPLESGHCRLEGRSTHPNQSLIRLITFATLCFAAAAFAQNSSLTGTVKDLQEASVSNAVVTLTD